MHQPLFSFLQQVISSFRGIQAFSEIKKDIEANFKQMKQCLVVEEGSRHEPQLAAQYINWWVQVQMLSWQTWWLTQQQQSDHNHTLFSMQDIRNNSEFNISGAVTPGGADRRPSPGRDLRVAVPVLTRHQFPRGVSRFEMNWRCCDWQWSYTTSQLHIYKSCRFLYCPPECGTCSSWLWVSCLEMNVRLLNPFLHYCYNYCYNFLFFLPEVE